MGRSRQGPASSPPVSQAWLCRTSTFSALLRFRLIPSLSLRCQHICAFLLDEPYTLITRTPFARTFILNPTLRKLAIVSEMIYGPVAQREWCHSPHILLLSSLLGRRNYTDPRLVSVVSHRNHPLPHAPWTRLRHSRRTLAWFLLCTWLHLVPVPPTGVRNDVFGWDVLAKINGHRRFPYISAHRDLE